MTDEVILLLEGNDDVPKYLRIFYSFLLSAHQQRFLPGIRLKLGSCVDPIDGFV